MCIYIYKMHLYIYIHSQPQESDEAAPKRRVRVLRGFIPMMLYGIENMLLLLLLLL